MTLKHDDIIKDLQDIVYNLDNKKVTLDYLAQKYGVNKSVISRYRDKYKSGKINFNEKNVQNLQHTATANQNLQRTATGEYSTEDHLNFEDISNRGYVLKDSFDKNNDKNESTATAKQNLQHTATAKQNLQHDNKSNRVRKQKVRSVAYNENTQVLSDEVIASREKLILAEGRARSTVEVENAVGLHEIILMSKVYKIAKNLKSDCITERKLEFLVDGYVELDECDHDKKLKKFCRTRMFLLTKYAKGIKLM